VATDKYENPDEEERNKKLRDDLFQSAVRKERPKNLYDLGTSTLKYLPKSIGMIQGLMDAVDWKVAQGEVLKGLENTVLIVGRPNTGKSTLFNTIKGATLSAVSPQAGTTREIVKADFGPFKLIDTPGVNFLASLPDEVKKGLDQVSVIVFLLDATRGLQSSDRELYQELKKLKKPMVIAVNKVDTLPGRASGDQLSIEVAVLLDFVGVIPISAKTGENVAEELIPAIIAASPEAALVIGHELPAYRQVAAQRIIRNSTLLSLAVGIEPIPLVDIPILLGTQIRLVLRLAALYGEPLDTKDAMKHARELLVTMAGGLGLRFLAEQLAKAVPFGGDFVAGAIAGAATWSIGQVALEYYDGGKQLSGRRMRQLFMDVYRLFRKNNTTDDVRQYALNGKDEPLLLTEAKEQQLER
jgi:small GTP-binding protein